MCEPTNNMWTLTSYVLDAQIYSVATNKLLVGAH